MFEDTDYNDDLLSIYSNTNSKNSFNTGQSENNFKLKKNNLDNNAPKYHPSIKRIVLGDCGTITNHFVGSKDEDCYFRVMLSSRMFGNDRPIKLFYNHPRDYCVHYVTKLLPRNKRPNSSVELKTQVNKLLTSIEPIIKNWEKKQENILWSLKEENEKTLTV